jgi:glutaredoxin 3
MRGAKEIAAMKKIEMYTTPACPYCHAAKRLLAKKGAAFTDIDVSRDPALRSAMTGRSGGVRTVPQIFIGGQHVGGSDDLHALDHSGKLDALLAE